RAGSLGTAPPAAPRCRGYWGGPRFGRDRIGGHDGNRRAGLPLPLRARERLLRRAGARRLRLPVRAHPRLPAPLRVAGGGAGDPLRLAAGPAMETFRSSGTTGGGAGEEGGRSVHRHPFPELYRQAVDASFPFSCLRDPADRPPILSLVPGRQQLPDSSLSFMADHLLARYGGPGRATALGTGGVDLPRARSWAGARQRDGRPALVLATAFALADWLQALARQDLRFRLPAGTVVFETGGFKGRTRELSRPELLAQVAERLGVPGASVVREYGMTELTSQCYTRTLAGGDADLFAAPHWVRVRVLDPATLAAAPAGVPGLLAVLDLAT